MRQKQKLTGRPPKLNPKYHRLTVRFNDEEYTKFLSMYNESKCYAKAVFLKEMLFGRTTFRVILPSTDPHGYYSKLTTLYAKMRRLGVDYNTTVKEMKCKFSENKTLALLHRLERITREMTTTCNEIVALTHKVEAEWQKELIKR